MLSITENHFYQDWISNFPNSQVFSQEHWTSNPQFFIKSQPIFEILFAFISSHQYLNLFWKFGRKRFVIAAVQKCIINGETRIRTLEATWTWSKRIKHLHYHPCSSVCGDRVSRTTIPALQFPGEWKSNLTKSLLVICVLKCFSRRIWICSWF